MTINIIAFIISYLICSISPSIIICKSIKGDDIRDFGSGNAGTTNSIRVLGKFWGIVTFLCDIGKTVLAYYIIYLITSIFKIEYDVSAKCMYLIGSVVGHCYPIYYKFKGGKGVATIITAMMIIDAQIMIVVLIAGVIIALVSKMVSLASISSMVLLNIMTFFMLPEYILPVLIIGVLIIYKHKDNIDRIMKGTESKLFKK